MQIASGWSVQADSASAVDEAVGRLAKGSGGASAELLFLYATPDYDAATVLARASELTGRPVIIGGTSCQGVATEEGFHSEGGRALGLLALGDAPGPFGAGLAHYGDDPKAAARQALRAALAQAGRPGESPALVWLVAAPGHEEAVLAAIEALLGPDVPILGGSTADNDLSGQWRQFANLEVASDAVAVATLFLDPPPSYAYHNGYEPTACTGRVTRSAGRVIHEIDGRPAAEVYADWIGGVVGEAVQRAWAQGGGCLLDVTTFHPLGWRAGSVVDTEYYLLSHPKHVEADGSLHLFTQIATGNEAALMVGTRAGLIARAGQVARIARTLSDWPSSLPSGAITVYCAGCMLAVADSMDAVIAGLRTAMGGRPFLTAFTYGEQGCHGTTGNLHGNLMISAVCFGP